METPRLWMSGTTVMYGAYRALNAFECAVPAGQYVLLVGENGAGKSTLLRCAAGWQRPTAGAVAIDGQALESHERVLRGRLKLVPDTPQFYSELTVWEHVAWVAEAHRMREWEADAKKLMEAFGIARNGSAYPQSFSRGMQYKLALIMALITQPSLLLLDEPFGPLDPYSQEFLARYLAGLSATGVSILASSHLLPDADPPDRVLVLDQGELIEDAGWADISTRYPDVPVPSLPLNILRDAIRGHRENFS